MQSSSFELIPICRGDVDLAATPRIEAALRSERDLELCCVGALARTFREHPGPRGRAATAVLSLPALGERVLVRELRRGGAFGALVASPRDAWKRATRELGVTASLRNRSAPVPEPALVWRDGNRCAVGTVFVRDSRDALAWLSACRSIEELLTGLRALGEAVRRFHDAGGSHPDLQIKNLLVSGASGAEPEGTVIDLSGAPQPADLTPARRMRELMRLFRSGAKRGCLARVGKVGLATFFSAYVAGDRTLRRALWRALPREYARVKRHALLYPGGSSSLRAPWRPRL